MSRQIALLLSVCLVAFVASLTLALPPAGPWTNFVSKPVYSRALGPPGGLDTISVPYMPKSPFMPKFVDPKTFISKKTDMLSNLFGGLGPVKYNVADTKPIIPYGSSGSSLDNTESTLFNKRDILQDNKGKIIESSNVYKRGMFGPFASKFGSMSPTGPKFGPYTPFFSPEITPDFMDKASFSRRKRAVDASSADSIPSSPSNPAADALKAYLPKTLGPFGPGGPFGFGGPFGPGGPFGFGGPLGSGNPFGPSGPFGPVVDPSPIISKKSDFLDTLFKNLATTAPTTTTTEAPTPKSTIVPPNFWIPSSVIPGPTEYTQKVSDFLDKLFDSLNATTSEPIDDSDTKSDFLRSLISDDISSDKIARSLDDVSFITAAKDTIVDTILSELGDLKGDMIATLNDLIAYEKTASAATSAKKPFKPFSGKFPFAKPTVDPTLPFQQRMAVLSQVFDMLTDLQKNISVVAKSAIASNASAPNNPESSKVPSPNAAFDASSINNTLLAAILKKISTIEAATPASYSVSYLSSYPADPAQENPIMSRDLPKEPTSFWVSYPESSASAVKRQVNDDLLPYLEYENGNSRHDQRQYTRGVQMQMHQGYQSLPAGAVESVQAGGGSTPEHQGGGIKLLGSNAYGNSNKWADWMQYRENQYQDRRHHHNHH